MLPFTSEQFVSVFTRYNATIWPAQVAAYLLGSLAVLLLFRRSSWWDRIIATILALMWAWTGFAYHLLFFATINKAAYVFFVLFVVQSAALVYASIYRDIDFGLPPGPATWVGASFVIYAAVAYPLIGMAAGHRAAELPMFGVTPCPVTIFTFGLLLLTVRRPPIVLLVIPTLWSVIGGSAAFLLRVPQDWPLLFSSAVAVPMILAPKPKAAIN
ncbi:DUF6064 family protein [Bradyrhizobium quebecense]|uniref:DUF6064 family protein n=2 Tax=Bradyrhizobium quebecense TaxID=2748629 RepID=A0ACD3V787_9BRAD|nr:DUF6064 family protein [Bradyrhizobium quebecense]UGY02249.1 DUF6064 family protein [Bradyrhizobium quebecense]